MVPWNFVLLWKNYGTMEKAMVLWTNLGYFEKKKLCYYTKSYGTSISEHKKY